MKYFKSALLPILILFLMNEACNNVVKPVPVESGYIKIGHAQIYYEVFGAGEPVVLIHAGITDSRMWNYQIKDLSLHFKVIRYDMLGFGKSDKPDSIYNPNVDLLNILDTCHIQKANLVGISLGAMQAIDFTVNYPQRVKSLIISGTGFIDWPYPKETLDRHIEFSKYVAENGPDSAVRRILTDSFWNQSLPGKEYPEARKLFEQILDENKNSFTVNWQLRKFTAGLKDRLSEIHCPTLMFRPENDMPTMVAISDTIEEKIRDIRVIGIKKVSHLLNMERPEEFNNAIIEFIKSE